MGSFSLLTILQIAQQRPSFCGTVISNTFALEAMINETCAFGDTVIAIIPTAECKVRMRNVRRRGRRELGGSRAFSRLSASFRFIVPLAYF